MITMKETTKEKRIRARMMPGIVTLNGFLGKDKRTLAEIIEEDEKALQSLSRTAEEIAQRMQYLTDATFDTFDNKAIIEDIYEVETEVTRGTLACPYAHGGQVRKLVTKLTNKEKNLTIQWTAMNIHLIKEHHFFEGKGSTFRINPADIVKALF